MQSFGREKIAVTELTYSLGFKFLLLVNAVACYNSLLESGICAYWIRYIYIVRRYVYNAFMTSSFSIVLSLKN